MSQKNQSQDASDEPSTKAEPVHEPSVSTGEPPVSADAAQSPTQEFDVVFDLGSDDVQDTPREQDAALRSKKSKKKPKTPKRAKAKKAAGPKPRAAETGADQSDGAGGASAPTDMPDMTILSQAAIGAGSPPPPGTLPPSLEGAFPDGVSLVSLLAVTSAVAGPSLQFDAGKNANGAGGLALRVAIVGMERGLPPAVAPVLRAAYSLEEQEVALWHEKKRLSDLRNAADGSRRRLFQQTLANATILSNSFGLPAGFDLAIAAPSPPSPPRPRFLLRDPVPSEIKRGLEETNFGIVIVDGRRMPAMSGFGVNYDAQTSALLNDAAAGAELELVDPGAGGCVRMRPVTAAVIGMLSAVDIYSLHKAGASALTATLFVAADPGTQSNSAAATVASEIVARVRKLTANPTQTRLQLSGAARKVIDQVVKKFAKASTEVLPPLADYYAAAADLVGRLAVVLHVLDCVANDADQITAEIGRDVLQRAVAFVEKSALPSACSVLSPTSVAPEVRDARRIVSFAQQYASAEFPTLLRRDMVRIFQRSMSIADVDRAIRRSVVDGVLSPPNSDAANSAGQVFHIHPMVFEPAYQLPDLVTDPRRLR